MATQNGQVTPAQKIAQILKTVRAPLVTPKAINGAIAVAESQALDRLVLVSGPAQEKQLAWATANTPTQTTLRSQSLKTQNLERVPSQDSKTQTKKLARAATTSTSTQTTLRTQSSKTQTLEHAPSQDAKTQTQAPKGPSFASRSTMTSQREMQVSTAVQTGPRDAGPRDAEAQVTPSNPALEGRQATTRDTDSESSTRPQMDEIGQSLQNVDSRCEAGSVAASLANARPVFLQHDESTEDPLGLSSHSAEDNFLDAQNCAVEMQAAHATEREVEEESTEENSGRKILASVSDFSEEVCDFPDRLDAVSPKRSPPVILADSPPTPKRLREAAWRQTSEDPQGPSVVEALEEQYPVGHQQPKAEQRETIDSRLPGRSTTEVLEIQSSVIGAHTRPSQTTMSKTADSPVLADSLTKREPLALASTTGELNESSAVQAPKRGRKRKPENIALKPRRLALLLPAGTGTANPQNVLPSAQTTSAAPPLQNLADEETLKIAMSWQRQSDIRIPATRLSIDDMWLNHWRWFEKTRGLASAVSGPKVP